MLCRVHGLHWHADASPMACALACCRRAAHPALCCIDHPYASPAQAGLCHDDVHRVEGLRDKRVRLADDEHAGLRQAPQHGRHARAAFAVQLLQHLRHAPRWSPGSEPAPSCARCAPVWQPLT